MTFCSIFVGTVEKPKVKYKLHVVIEFHPTCVTCLTFYCLSLNIQRITGGRRKEKKADDYNVNVCYYTMLSSYKGLKSGVTFYPGERERENEHTIEKAIYICCIKFTFQHI